MSRGVARFGDRLVGTCFHPSHTPPLQTGATIITSSGDTTVNALGATRFSDQIITDCGHTDFILLGSGTVTANFLGVSRLGDTSGLAGIFVGTIITASPNVNTP